MSQFSTNVSEQQLHTHTPSSTAVKISSTSVGSLESQPTFNSMSSPRIQDVTSSSNRDQLNKELDKATVGISGQTAETPEERMLAVCGDSLIDFIVWVVGWELEGMINRVIDEEIALFRQRSQFRTKEEQKDLEEEGQRGGK